MFRNYRHFLITSFTFVGGFYFFLEYFLPEKIGDFEFGYYHDQINTGVRLVGSMAIGLGVINILKVHSKKILKTQPGWLNSIALLLGLFVVVGIEGYDMSRAEHREQVLQEVAQLPKFLETIKEDFDKNKTEPAPRVATLSQVFQTVKERAANPESLLRVGTETEELRAKSELFQIYLENSEEQAAELQNVYRAGIDSSSLTETLSLSLKRLSGSMRDISQYHFERTQTRRVSEFITNGFFSALGSAMFSLLAFYIASAAYRAFRIRSFEASIMMITAVIVILGQIPHGPMYISEDLPAIRSWLMNNINVPAFRAIYFGATIAGLAMAVRMWLSLEQSPLAVEESEK